MTEGASLAQRVAGLPPFARNQLFTGFSERQLQALLYDWAFWARAKQTPPPGSWFLWLVLAGRGFGKTRMGAEWVRSLVESAGQQGGIARSARLALVAETAADARDVMIEGESGLLACARPGMRPVYEPSKRRVSWPNGVQATLYSADDPDQLRGPQHHFAWCDELAKWRYGAEVWSNLSLGLRLGRRPRVMVTTTPRPTQLLRDLIAAPGTALTQGSTHENRANLPPAFFDQVVATYQGTRLGRQELEAELLEDTPGALWQRDQLVAQTRHTVPSLQRVVVAVDPPVTAHAKSDACGIVVCGRDAQGQGWVLDDCTLQGVSPARWAHEAIAAFHRHQADRIVAEVNNGGDLVEAVLRQVDADVPYRPVHAARGKIARAEPVAALYEQGRVFHATGLSDLEDQMCGFTGEVQRGQVSPDRVDALVWGLSELMLGRPLEPRVRSMT